MREVFLALLAGAGSHGYEIKRALEEEFGSEMPALNSGQLYSTLARWTAKDSSPARTSTATAAGSGCSAHRTGPRGSGQVAG